MMHRLERELDLEESSLDWCVPYYSRSQMAMVATTTSAR